MRLYPRAILPLLRSRVTTRRIVVLTGARQTGKTTLARDLLPSPEIPPILYITLDDPDERRRLLDDPVRRLDHPGRLVVLDEVQKAPALLDAVKLLADRNGAHRFLLLGSSQILLLQKVRETLAGRVTVLELWPLALAEKVEAAEAPAPALSLIWDQGEEALRQLRDSSPSADIARVWRGIAEDHLQWGGYPALAAIPPSERAVWLRDFRRTYLERDLADLGRVADLDQFASAQDLLAARTGQILSYSEVARELGVAQNTVKRYIRFLEISYQVYLLRPLLPTAARLVKSPKLYWTDPGLVRVLSDRLGETNGALFETAVVDELLRWASWQGAPPRLHFFRTYTGREVDVMLSDATRLLAIEVRAGRYVDRRTVRTLRDALEAVRWPRDARVLWRLGIVVTRGRDVDEVEPGIWEVPFERLFGPGTYRTHPGTGSDGSTGATGTAPYPVR
ncbi:MAG: ATP-binding protein [Armatimonadota bacterium]|nr:ATP-binding protein [Armatimonadota bacterium]